MIFSKLANNIHENKTIHDIHPFDRYDTTKPTKTYSEKEKKHIMLSATASTIKQLIQLSKSISESTVIVSQSLYSDALTLHTHNPIGRNVPHNKIYFGFDNQNKPELIDIKKAGYLHITNIYDFDASRDSLYRQQSMTSINETVSVFNGLLEENGFILDYEIGPRNTLDVLLVPTAESL